MKKTYRNIFFAILAIIVLIQIIPVDRSNPQSEAEIIATSDVKTILENSCYDCHSNQTNWPWYSYIAPVSWLVSKDVHDGRKHLNFSNWENLSTEKKADKLDEIWEYVSKGEMPMPIYTFMHPSAKLSNEQKTVLKNWTSGEMSNLPPKAHNHEEHED